MNDFTPWPTRLLGIGKQPLRTGLLVLLGLAMVVPMGCGSSGKVNSGADTAYENPLPALHNYGLDSCGAALPTETLASIGVSVSLRAIPHEKNFYGSSRWDVEVGFRGVKDFNSVRIKAEGLRVVVVDTQSERVLTVAQPGNAMIPTNGNGYSDADGVFQVPAVVDAWECPPPSDPRLHASGEVKGLKELPDGEHMVMLIVDIGNTAYRSDPIKMVLGKP